MSKRGCSGTCLGRVLERNIVQPVESMRCDRDPTRRCNFEMGKRRFWKEQRSNGQETDDVVWRVVFLQVDRCNPYS